MRKEQMVELLDKIESFFPGKFKADERTAKTWWSVIQKYDFNTCERNLEKHVKGSEWPPTIANLIAGQKDDTRGYSESLIKNIESGESYEELIARIEKRSGRKVKR